MTLSFGANPEFSALMTLEVSFYTYSVCRVSEGRFPVKNPCLVLFVSDLAHQPRAVRKLRLT